MHPDVPKTRNEFFDIFRNSDSDTDSKEFIKLFSPSNVIFKVTGPPHKGEKST